MSPLENLPVELLQLISNHLGQADRASLSLISRKMHYIIDPNTYKNLTTHQRFILLSRLANDLPDTYFCPYCQKLHPTHSITLPGAGSPISPTALSCCPEQNAALDIYFMRIRPVYYGYFDIMDYDLHICHVTLAVKRYHLGAPHGIPTEWLSSTMVRHTRDNILRLLSVEAQVTGGDESFASLTLQIQTWTMKYKPAAAEEEEAAAAGMTIGVAETRIDSLMQKILCCHHELSLEMAVTDAPPPLLERYGHSCKSCGIHPHIETRTCGRYGTALVVTKWLDVGPGMNVTDSRWQGAMLGNYREWYDYVDDVESVRERFMAVTGNKALEITTNRNQGYLLDERYKRLFNRVESDGCEAWVLPMPKP